MEAQSTPIPVTGTAQAIYAGPCTLRGFYISSTVGADVVLYDNASAASGTILGQFTLAAKGDKPVTITDGARCLNGIFLSATAAVQGHVRIA